MTHPIMLCTPGRCCPVVTPLGDDTFEVVDDFTVSDVFTKQQLLDAGAKAKLVPPLEKFALGDLTMEAGQAALLVEDLFKD